MTVAYGKKIYNSDVVLSLFDSDVLSVMIVTDVACWCLFLLMVMFDSDIGV